MDDETLHSNEYRSENHPENPAASFGVPQPPAYDPEPATRNADGQNPPASVSVGQHPSASDAVGQSRSASDGDGQGPTASEPVGLRRTEAERSDFHTVTSDEAVDMFRSAGVPRTRRSITRWCNGEAGDDARLDSYKDQNDGRYYITPKSIDLVIQEERAKDERQQRRMQPIAEPQSQRPPTSDAGAPQRQSSATDSQDGDDDATLRARIQRLQIDAQVKEKMIEFHIKERERDAKRIEQVSRYIGHLEARVRQIDGPSSEVLRMGDGRPYDKQEGLGIADNR